MLSVWTYDGLKILVEAIKKAGEDRGKIREAILATQGYKGAQGTYSFTPNGDGMSEVSIVQIEKGQPKLLKIVNLGNKIGASRRMDRNNMHPVSVGLHSGTGCI